MSPSITRFCRPAWLLPALLLMGCPPAQVENQLDRDLYFDLKGYMQTQIDSLNRVSPGVHKTVILNGAAEEQTKRGLDFSEELQVFVAADINKPAWQEKYSVDSVRFGGKLEALRYFAIDSTLTVRELRIDFREGAVSRVFVQSLTGTVLSDGARELLYLPGEGYEIRTRQKSMAAKPVSVEISSVFVD
jgi:hypothetical protein